MLILATALLILSGIILIILEILVLPGLISGIVGGILMVMGVILSYQWFGFTYGNLTLLITIVVFIAAIFLSFKSNIWKRLSLKTEIDGKVNLMEVDNIKIGDQGKTISRMGTMGKIQVNNQIYEAKTNGEFIDVNVPVEIIKITDSIIIVKPLK